MTQPKRTEKTTDTTGRPGSVTDPVTNAVQSATDVMLDMAAASRSAAFATMRAGLAVQEEALKSMATMLTGTERMTVATGDAAREIATSGVEAARSAFEQWNALVNDGLRKHMELMAFPMNHIVK
ncbi:MAG: hypothetical protein SNJ62_13190 [Chloracidobacterium sp.]|uniref:Phasin domain-containing protein n=1 Tax=Chloracidobacterium validum TaxID=2821543 RepID=A0ABX8BG70_9BACT|nr:hypothetical protein [Chloracidobacterium validum]QUW04080.1 hypothetical protein J8C06_13585 [Chloracidobacterium validum]